MKRWIGAGLLAATLMVTGCVSNGGMGAITGMIAITATGIIATDIIGTATTGIAVTTGIGATTVITGASGR